MRVAVVRRHPLVGPDRARVGRVDELVVLLVCLGSRIQRLDAVAEHLGEKSTNVAHLDLHEEHEAAAAGERVRSTEHEEVREAGDRQAEISLRAGLPGIEQIDAEIAARLREMSPQRQARNEEAAIRETIFARMSDPAFDPTSQLGQLREQITASGCLRLGGGYSASIFAMTSGGSVTDAAAGNFVIAAKALTEIRPATRVAISLLISWTFQLFVKSSN